MPAISELTLIRGIARESHGDHISILGENMMKASMKRVSALALLLGTVALAASPSAMAAIDRVYVHGSSCVTLDERIWPVVIDEWGIRANEKPTPAGLTMADVVCPISVTAPPRNYTAAQLVLYGYNRNSALGENSVNCTLQATDSVGGNLRRQTATLTRVQQGAQTASTYMAMPANMTMYFSVRCHLPKVTTLGPSHVTAMTLQLQY